MEKLVEWALSALSIALPFLKNMFEEKPRFEIRETPSMSREDPDVFTVRCVFRPRTKPSRIRYIQALNGGIARYEAGRRGKPTPDWLETLRLDMKIPSIQEDSSAVAVPVLVRIPSESSTISLRIGYGLFQRFNVSVEV